MDQALIERINFLARKSRTEGLTVAEHEEQTFLRAKYIEAYRKNLRGILDNTVIAHPDGSREKLKKK